MGRSPVGDIRMKTDKKPNVAVIGAGYWGVNLVRVFFESGVLRAVCDTSGKALKACSARFPGIKLTSSINKILEDGSIDAVIISTPAVTHYKIARLALENGKDVFVEKPIALTSREAEELSSLAKKRGRILMVGHILNYHPAIIRLKEMVRKGTLGRIQYIYSNRLNIGKLRTEENILWSFAPHDISVVLSLIGKEPSRVIAAGGAYINKGIYDTTMTVLEFEDGVKGHIFVSWLHPFKEQKLIVVGSKVMAVFDDMTKEKLFLYPHRIEWKNGRIPVAFKAEHYPVAVAQREPLKEEAKHFIECVMSRKTPRTDAREGIRVLKILEKAEESIMRNNSSEISKKEKFFVHPSSYVDENVSIGEGTKIWHFSHILKDTKIGKNCVIGQNVTIGPAVKIGNRCKIQNNVSIYKSVILEDDVFCGPSCVFTNVYNPRSFVERKDKFLPTLVKKGATIGANATVICGVTIGRYSFVGAGALVKRDVPDYSLVVGLPSRQIGWVCRCGAPLKGLAEKHKAVCKECANVYGLIKGKFAIIKERA